MDATSSEANGKTVLIFDDDLSLESVNDKIVALGHTFQNKTVHLKPLDWKKFDNELKHLSMSGNLLAILMIISNKTMFLASSSEDSSELFSLWTSLLLEVKKYPCLIFVNKDIFLGNFLEYDIERLITGMRSRIRILVEDVEHQRSVSVFHKEKL